MRNFRFPAALIASVTLAALAACSSGPAATSPPAAAWHQVTGRIAGAPYQIDLPVRWNHTLIVWSHGYEPGGYPRVDDIEPVDRKSTRLNSSHVVLSRMPSSA